MANELLYSGAGDLTLSEILHQEVLRLLADRNYLGNHPALAYCGDAQGTGSTTVKKAALGWDGYDILQDTNENTAATETAFTDDSFTVTVARKALSRNYSDLMRIVDALGIVTDPVAFAQDAVGAQQGKLMDMIADVGDGFTATAGPGTGVDLDYDSFLEAAIALDIANAQGPMLSVLHGRQWGDLQQYLLTATGTVQWMPASAEAIEMRGAGFKGQLAGVDIFVSNRVKTINAGADRAGFIFTKGAILWADATIPVDPHAFALYAGPKIMVEFERNSSSAMKKVTYNSYLGASLGIDAAGITLISDA